MLEFFLLIEPRNQFRIFLGKSAPMHQRLHESLQFPLTPTPGKRLRYNTVPQNLSKALVFDALRRRWDQLPAHFT